MFVFVIFNRHPSTIHETGFVTVALSGELEAFSSFAGNDYAIKDYSGA
jgi:hypothetical protein